MDIVVGLIALGMACAPFFMDTTDMTKRDEKTEIEMDIERTHIPVRTRTARDENQK